MLRVDRIERHYHAGEHERLLRDVADNGLILPLPLRLRLAQGPVPAVALGLRRVAEVTYGPTPLTRDMTATLLREQRGDGAFDADADADSPDPLATAAAIAALNQVIAEHPGERELVAQARDRALAALLGMQDDAGLFRSADDRDEPQRALVSAFILSLLAGDETFRATVRYSDLMSWFDERADLLERETAALYRLARAATDPTATPKRRRRVPAAA